MQQSFFDIIVFIERLHQLFSEVMEAELRRIGVRDITPVQCFVLYNIGVHTFSVGEILNRGYYLGSNVSYNLKKMAGSGYILHEVSATDKRSSTVRLTEKGLDLCRRIDAIFQRQVHNMKYNSLTEENLQEGKNFLSRLESFWSFLLSHDLRLSS